MNVLLVEDDALIAMMVEDMIADLGHTVHPADCVSQAMTILNETEINCALLDVTLANENSYPVADTLLERNIPFAFGTGHGRHGVDDRYEDCPVLMKPFAMNDILSFIKSQT